MARYQEFLSLSPKLESFRLTNFHILILPYSDLQTQAKFEYESRLVDIEMMVIKKFTLCRNNTSSRGQGKLVE